MATGQRTTQTALEVLRLDADAANRRRREFYTTTHADNLQRASDEAQAAFAALIDAGRALSRDLEHSIAVANLHAAGTVLTGHPIRTALDEFDVLLARCGGAA